MVTEPILAGQSVTVAAQDVMVYVVVAYTVEVVYCVTSGVVVGAATSVLVLVTGHTVVYNTLVSVTTVPFPGQFVTVGAHEVIVRVISV